MTNYPDQPSGANEFAPLESTPSQPDPYAPVDYPATSPGASPTVLGSGYPPPPLPPGYPQAAAYPPPPAYPGYPPAPPGYPQAAAYPPPVGYPYGAGPYGNAQPQPSTNGMAIGSMVASLAALPFYFLCGVGVIASIVGVVLGVISLNQLKQGGQQGRGMAITGIAVGGVFLVLFIGFWIIVAASGN